MNKVIHAHELLNFIQANPQLTTIDDIKGSFIDRFGDVSFTNCTNNIYTFDEIFEFLFQRNKVENIPNGIRIIENNRCKDD